MTHSYVWHDSFICVTWLIHMCDMTHSYVWHDSFMTHSYVWHDSFICVTWLIHMCDMTHSWLIRMCDIKMTYSYVWHDSFTHDISYPPLGIPGWIHWPMGLPVVEREWETRGVAVYMKDSCCTSRIYWVMSHVILWRSHVHIIYGRVMSPTYWVMSNIVNWGVMLYVIFWRSHVHVMYGRVMSRIYWGISHIVYGGVVESETCCPWVRARAKGINSVRV